MPGKAQPSPPAISELLIWRMCGAWPKTLEIRVRVDFEMAELSAGNSFPPPARAEWSEDGRAVCEAEGNPTAPAVSTGVGSQGMRETEPEQPAQLLGRVHGMIAAVQVTKAIEAFDHHGQQAEQPTDQHAVGMMMTDMLEAVAVLGVIEALVFNLPTALSHVIERETTELARGEVSQPVSLNERAIGFVLAVANHAHGGPLESLPGIEIVGVPDLDALLLLVINTSGWSGAKALLYGAG